MECNNCGTVFRSQIPPDLKEKVQYGSGLQAFALSLTNTVNAAMNKASMFLAGITSGESVSVRDTSQSSRHVPQKGSASSARI